MLKLTLLKLRLKPQRLLISLSVAVFSLFFLSLGWLQITRVAKRKVETTVAKVSKKLGVPIEIGRFTITPVGAHFEDLRIGAESNIVISRMTAEVGLNPFGANFGELESVTVYKVRVKAGVSRMNDSVTSLKAAGLLDSDKSATAQKSIEKFFAAMPAQRLQLNSAAVAIVDDDGQPLLTVRGAQLIIDKRRSKVLFRVESIKSKEGLADGFLQGRFELSPDTDDYRFFVRRNAGARTKAYAWAVSGLLKKDLGSVALDVDFKTVPNILDPYVERYFGQKPRLNVKGKITASRDRDTWNFQTRLVSTGTRLVMPLLSSRPVGPVRFDLTGKGFVKPDDRIVAIESAEVAIPVQRTGRYGKAPVRFTLRGAGRLPEAKDAQEGFAVEGQVQLVTAPCQAVLDAAPSGLIPSLKGFKLDGTTGAVLTFNFDSQKPEAAGISMHDGVFGCRVLKAPYSYSAEHLAGAFSLQREVGKNDEPLEINVNPLSPDFTPLEQVSKSINVAFVTSEDASFFAHKGIDAIALESAFKRNLVEKRVAVGGSTITMQTVKNLFLTQERTLSRKLQELFLAWHLENILTKDRILEIYVNIVELGPGIYGVGQASEHFFGKRAADLNLLESAYLATLLPSPKIRYRYFCDGKLTPNFNDMVRGLLKRMVNLNRINFERYSQAMSASLQFNDSERNAAPECNKHDAVPDDEDPS